VPDSLAATWRISDQAIANAVADETVILHLGNGTYFGLDAIGARLWDAIKGGAAPASVCASLLAEYDVDQATLEADLRALLAELAENNLISPA
jgi:Coenzyme PQQ synthesis protein D (PqqD)